MASSLKLQKEMETDIHEQLYSNIFMLTLKYPTTKEFNACFRKDMFTKNNKAAYLHVVHFLLNVLDPTFFKQRNIWPPLDARMETQFRNELMKYINELNSINKETGIPSLMTSHLILPGGYRFAEFIFRLSQYVLCEDVKRQTSNNLFSFPPKAASNFNIASEQVKNIEKVVENQYNSLIMKQKVFDLKLNAAKETIQNIISQQPRLKQETKEIEDKLEGYYKTNESQIISISQTLTQREGLICGKLIKLENDSDCFQKCCTLMDILSEDKNTVSCKIEINNCSNNSGAKNHVDLVEYLESLLETLENNRYTIKNRKEPNLPEYVLTSSGIVKDLTEHANKYEELIQDLELCISHLEGYNANGALHTNYALFEKLRKVFETIPPVNFSKLM